MQVLLHVPVKTFIMIIPRSAFLRSEESGGSAMLKGMYYSWNCKTLKPENKQLREKVLPGNLVKPHVGTQAYQIAMQNLLSRE